MSRGSGTGPAAGRPGRERGALRHAVAALRVHQWCKNLLLFVPPLAAHRFTWSALRPAAVGFLAFSLCASSAYVVNDLVDREADRAHPEKRDRPFASGAIPAGLAPAIAAALLAPGLLAGWSVGPPLLGAVALYWGTAVAYTLALKRVPALDVLVLAGLYTWRILAGSIATGVPTSSWLLTLSMFLFLSLALVKRTSELRRAGLEGARAPGRARGYVAADLAGLSSLGAASGLVAVLVLALYLSSPDAVRIYAHRERLWLLCPLALYWVTRLWLLAQRGCVSEDPVLFALRDRVSLLVGALSLVVLVAAA